MVHQLFINEIWGSRGDYFNVDVVFGFGAMSQNFGIDLQNHMAPKPITVLVIYRLQEILCFI
jgi:hypothetical protein